MMDRENIASYIVYARCGKKVIKGSSRKDIFTVFVTTHPNYRKRGLATKIVNEMLHGVNLNYRTSYKTIVDSNIGSKKAAFSNSYKEEYQAKKSKILKTISYSGKGDWRLYSYTNN